MLFVFSHFLEFPTIKYKLCVCVLLRLSFAEIVGGKMRIIFGIQFEMFPLVGISVEIVQGLHLFPLVLSLFKKKT